MVTEDTTQEFNNSISLLIFFVQRNHLVRVGLEYLDLFHRFRGILHRRRESVSTGREASHTSKRAVEANVCLNTFLSARILHRSGRGWDPIEYVEGHWLWGNVAEITELERTGDLGDLAFPERRKTPKVGVSEGMYSMCKRVNCCCIMSSKDSSDFAG